MWVAALEVAEVEGETGGVEGGKGEVAMGVVVVLVDEVVANLEDDSLE